MRVLVLVDIQNDFIKNLPKFKSVFNKIKSIINNYDYYVITKDEHPKKHCSFVKRGGNFNPHCIKDTVGAELYKPLKRLLEKLELEKRTVTILKGQDENIDQLGVDCYDKDFDSDDLVIDFVGLFFDTTVLNCARITKCYHPNIEVNIIEKCTIKRRNDIVDLKKVNVI